MRITKNPAILVLLFLCSLTACGDTPLAEPELLKYPKSEWPERTQSMTTQDLFYVYRYHLSLKPPYDSSFAEYLGKRGKQAILVWIEGLESDQKPRIDRPYLFGPIVQQAYYRGGYDMCADNDTLNRAGRALIRPQVARDIKEAISLLRSSCVKTSKQ
jgi:predicted small lipoprotein YifL